MLLRDKLPQIQMRRSGLLPSVIAACRGCIVSLWMSRDYRVAWYDCFSRRTWPRLNKDANEKLSRGRSVAGEIFMKLYRKNSTETHPELLVLNVFLPSDFLPAALTYFRRFLALCFRSAKTCRMPGSVPVPATLPPSLTSSRSAPLRYFSKYLLTSKLKHAHCSMGLYLIHLDHCKVLLTTLTSG